MTKQRFYFRLTAEFAQVPSWFNGMQGGNEVVLKARSQKRR